MIVVLRVMLPPASQPRSSTATSAIPCPPPPTTTTSYDGFGSGLRQRNAGCAPATSGADALRGAALERGDALEVLEHALERLDVAELRVDVEQVPLDDAGDAVADRLAHDDRPEALRDRVLDRVAHAAGH